MFFIKFGLHSSPFKILKRIKTSNMNEILQESNLKLEYGPFIGPIQFWKCSNYFGENFQFELCQKEVS